MHNLRANPRAHIEVGTDAYDVTARELPHDERDEIFDEGRRGGAGFRRIPVEDVSRVIPLFELTSEV